MSKTATKPETTSDTLSQWPPQAHIAEVKNGEVVKEGDVALCGVKLMGLDLKNIAQKAVCKECMAIAKGTRT